EVRPARRCLQRDVVGEDRDGARLVRADERIQVGAVGDRVLRDLRCFPVGGHRYFTALTSLAAMCGSRIFTWLVPEKISISPEAASRTWTTTGPWPVSPPPVAAAALAVVASAGPATAPATVLAARPAPAIPAAPRS